MKRAALPIECNRNCNRPPSNPSHAMQRHAIRHMPFSSGSSCEFSSGAGESQESGLASLSLENCCRGNSTVGSNPTLSAIPTGGHAQAEWYTSSRRNKNLIRGWDSKRGSEGDMSPSWGVYEGAGPLCRSVRSLCGRDFEFPPSPPPQACSYRVPYSCSWRPDNTPPVKFSLTASCHERSPPAFRLLQYGLLASPTLLV